MCCMFAILLILGPRVAGMIWWLLRPGLWQAAFSSFIWPVLGLIFLPWTTIMYLFVFPGGVISIEWVFIGFAVIADITSYFGSAYTNRDRLPGYNRPANPY